MTMGKGAVWVLAAAAAAMAAVTALSQNPDLTGHRVHRLPARVPQDGQVETNQADRFVVDNCEIQGEPPFEVLRIVKRFEPPPGFRFDVFRDGERDEARIEQALSNRHCYAFAPGNWEWSFWARRPDYVDVWFDPEDLIAMPWVGETPWEAKTVYEANAAEGPNAILVTALLAHSQKAAHFPLRCDGNLAPTNHAGGGIGIVQGHHWQALVAGGIDLDVDSDNTAAAPSFVPERTSWEDAIESGCATNLGRLIVCNVGDSDRDGLVDYADLQHSNHFAVAILDVSNVTEAIDWPSAKVRFAYSASDPRGQSPTNPPAPGLLRLWTLDGTQLRTADSVADGGSWIAPGGEFPARLIFSNGVRVATLYMEGVNADPAADRLVKAEFAPCTGAPYLADQAQVSILKVDITNVVNTQIVRGHTLTNQVLTGNQASFQASVDVQPAGTQYFLRWHFLSSTSAWTGPFSVSTATWNTDVPSNATHTLGELLTVEASFETNGTICDSAVTNMRVFFDIDAVTDTHNRPAGNADANWFRHWGVDQDNAVSSYSATGTVVHFGKNVTFSYGGAGGGLTGTYNSNPNNPSIALYDGGHGAENHSWTSAAMTYTNSVGSNVVAAAGAISITWTNSGIDLLAIVIAHEAQHLNTDLRWQAPNGIWFLAYGARTKDDGDGVLEAGENDFDDDEIPNAVEDANPGFRWDVKSTHQPGFYLGGDDEEVWIENAVQATPGGTDGNDWAFEGKQSSPSN